MTAKEFNEKFPYGLKKTIYQFERAAYEIINSDEIDKLIKASSRGDKAMLKHLKGYWRGTEHWSDMHWILILEKAPASLLADIFVYMVSKDDTTIGGDDSED